MKARRAPRFPPLVLLLLALAAPGEAQQPTRVARIGVLVEHASVTPWLQAFREGLREAGYAEGTDVVIEYRHLQGAPDLAPALVAELLRLNVDVLLVGGAVTAQAARAQTTRIPIVFTSVGDPVRAGLAASLARPGGNVTGLSNVNPEMSRKQLELLKAAVPALSRVGVLYNSANPVTAASVTGLREAAPALGVELHFMTVRRPPELPTAFSALTGRRVSAVLAVSDPVLGSELAQLAGLAARHRLPAIYNRREFAEAGGLLSYGPSFADNYRRAAGYVDKILRGASPADLPIQQPTTFELVVNLKTARALGLTIPPSLLVRADQVIE